MARPTDTRRFEPSQRELRRMNEREERKAAAAMAVPDWKVRQIVAREKTKADLQRNGITIKHLEENYKMGYDAGFKDAATPTIKSIYAITAQVLHERYGFGKKRICDTLSDIDNKLCACVSYQDEIEKVWKDIGLDISFGDPFDRIMEVEK